MSKYKRTDHKYKFMSYLGYNCWDAQYIRLFELIIKSEIFQKITNNSKLRTDYLYISPHRKGFPNKLPPRGLPQGNPVVAEGEHLTLWKINKFSKQQIFCKHFTYN